MVNIGIRSIGNKGEEYLFCKGKHTKKKTIQSADNFRQVLIITLVVGARVSGPLGFSLFKELNANCKRRFRWGPRGL